MSTRPFILLFGRDALLVETRRLILNQRGYRTLAVQALSDFYSIPTREPVELLILCHSLDEDSCSEALNIAARRWPDAKSLALPGNVLKPNISARGDAEFESVGPRELVFALDHILRAPSTLSVCQGK